MRSTKLALAVVAVGAITLCWGALASRNDAMASDGAKMSAAAPSHEKVVHKLRGEVTAVDPTARTMTVKYTEGKTEQTVNVDVGDKTVIRRGKKHETLSDIKAGDHVWMKMEQSGDKRTAEMIRIRTSRHVAAK